MTPPRYTPDPITHLSDGECFVFGSNRRGAHGRGAAKAALKWGAVMGTGEGLVGRTYGIPTKGRRLEVLSVREIALAVDRFTRFATTRPDLTFMVTPIGTGLAGYSAKDIAPLFRAAERLPNVVLPEVFARWLEAHP